MPADAINQERAVKTSVAAKAVKTRRANITRINEIPLSLSAGSLGEYLGNIPPSCVGWRD